MRGASALIAAFLCLQTLVTEDAKATQPEWAPVGQSLPPSKRHGHSAVWTGSRMIVWGGTAAGSYPAGGGPLGDGGAYLPSTDQWLPIAAALIQPRSEHVAVWTGSQMIVWGGWDGTAPLGDGAIYDPHSNSWVAFDAGGPAWRRGMRGHWTGSELLVWGGTDPLGPGQGGAFDPVKRSWRSIAASEAPTAGANSVWTGTDLLVWNPGAGWRYSLATNAWDRITDVGAPSWRRGHGAVWTGSEMLVVGGGGTTFEPLPAFPGGAFDPGTQRWRPIAGWYGDDALLIWTGTQAMAFSGTVGPRAFPLQTGRVYDPASDTWRLAPMHAGTPIGRTGSAGVWDGQSLIFFGGFNSELFDRAGDALDSMGRLFPEGLPAALRAVFGDSFEG